MPPFRPMTMLDAILCDPPYGIRAGARKSGSRRESVKAVPTSLQRDHIPQTQPYSFVEILVDLLDFAARTLRMHGRLVFIVPTAVQEYDESELPHHPMLRIVANSEQRLTIRLARRFVTMEKVRAPPHRAVQRRSPHDTTGRRVRPTCCTCVLHERRHGSGQLVQQPVRKVAPFRAGGQRGCTGAHPKGATRPQAAGGHHKWLEGARGGGV